MKFYIFKSNNPVIESKLKLIKTKTTVDHDSSLTLTAQELYLVNIKNQLSDVELQQLENLLNAQIRSSPSLNEKNIIIAPRIGSKSSWSSKTCEVLKRCELSEITQIESVILYQATINLLSHQNLLHDQMTESVISDNKILKQIFNSRTYQAYKIIDILNNDGIKILTEINYRMGLALSMTEIIYLLKSYKKIKRNPTDVELMMFAQVNSEHCRHKIFNAKFIINGVIQNDSLFQMIKNTHINNPSNTLVAYHDNSSVIQGNQVKNFYPKFKHQYKFSQKLNHIVMKVETHNHPTAIAPHAGAATGNGGEIRDEAATGRGAKSKAGLTGFTVSNLLIPDFIQPWEKNSYSTPTHIKSALEIMINAPIGSASFNNEFGRPNLCGYFRSFAQTVNQINYAYHKPIMLAGGMGSIEHSQVIKKKLIAGDLIIQIGGPGLLIGLGGGAASSMASGDNDSALDFNSVQRSNPEMQRRAQELINRCSELGVNNPIIAIHDVGAGGLSNAISELIYGSQQGGTFELRDIPIEDPTMSALEIWCNESQERYVLAIKPHNWSKFKTIAQRENCPIAVVGHSTDNDQLIVHDHFHHNHPIDISTKLILAPQAQIIKSVQQVVVNDRLIDISYDLNESINRVLSHPTVGSKAFLITIADRSVGGYTARDQMVGPWQIPVADLAITTSDYISYCGEAMAIGEKTSVATLNPEAAARLALSEAITNLSASAIGSLREIKLSANWMAACDFTEQNYKLYASVKALSEFCIALDLAIPVGKDSLTMKTKLAEQELISPISLIISVFCRLDDVRKHLTPQLIDIPHTKLLLIKPSINTHLGGSILQECHNVISGKTPDINVNELSNLYQMIQILHQKNLMLSYHDVSDGGVFTTLCEMAFAAHKGLNITLAESCNVIDYLFNEEIAIVIQVKTKNIKKIITLGTQLKLFITEIAQLNEQDQINIFTGQQQIYQNSRINLEQKWNQVSYKIKMLRDNPITTQMEYDQLKENNSGLFATYNFTHQKKSLTHYLKSVRPRVAILREQGINGSIEMAAAFQLAGFQAIDLHMNDLLNSNYSLTQFVGLAIGGGFSFGDVLGAGLGWAKSILYNTKLRTEFSNFFNRPDTFSLGICNGCQVLAALRELIPQASGFPLIVKNQSLQFESRLVMSEILPTNSIFLTEMVGAKLPIIVAHGEGRILSYQSPCEKALQYIDNSGTITDRYPYNPNGSLTAAAAISSGDGRVLIMMPHPERTFRTVQLSWRQKKWGNMSPWFKIFINARSWVN